MIFPVSERATINSCFGSWICFTEIRSAGAAVLKVIAKKAATKRLLRSINYLVFTFVRCIWPTAGTGLSHLTVEACFIFGTPGPNPRWTQHSLPSACASVQANPCRLQDDDLFRMTS